MPKLEMEYIKEEEVTNKRKFIRGERRRAESLLDSVNAGVCACQGCRSTMEDVHRLILWSGIRRDENNKDVEEEPPTKRSKISLSENITSTGDDDLQQRNTPELESNLSSKDSLKSSPETKVSFFTICDGHGGVQAADFVNNHLFNNIIKHSNFEEDTETAILNGFEITEEAYTSYAKQEDIDGMVGTTVTAVLIKGNVLYVANLGDSEAVLCSKGEAVMLTESHIPSNPSEKSRVELVGGSIISDKKGTKRLGHPAWNPNFVNIGVTRAIGDLYFKNEEFVGNKKSGLIAMPSLYTWNLTEDDEFMIIASDGFWDVVSPSEAINFVSANIHLDSNSICRDLMEMSKLRRSKDNITVLLVKFTIPSLSTELNESQLFLNSSVIKL